VAGIKDLFDEAVEERYGAIRTLVQREPRLRVVGRIRGDTAAIEKAPLPGLFP